MKKKSFIMLVIAGLCIMTGCSKTPELNYTGKDILYTCTTDEVNLFKNDVNVNITDKQEFVMTNSHDEMEGYTDGLLEFNEENRPDVKKCYFVSYDEFEGEYANTSNIAFRDSVEGSIKLMIKGTYTFKVKDSQTFIKNYTSLDDIKKYFNTNILAVYIMNMQGKSYQDLNSEKELNEAYLQAINKMMSKYGVEATKILIEVTKK